MLTFLLVWYVVGFLSCVYLMLKDTLLKEVSPRNVTVTDIFMLFLIAWMGVLPAVSAIRLWCAKNKDHE